MFDVYKIREDFPILDRKVNNTDLVYFDNAATSQTPIQVIDAISDYYKKFNSNIQIYVLFEIKMAHNYMCHFYQLT